MQNDTTVDVVEIEGGRFLAWVTIPENGHTQRVYAIASTKTDALLILAKRLAQIIALENRRCTSTCQ